MLGKIFPSLVIGIFEFFVALLASAFVFDVPLGGSFTLLLGATFLFLLSTLGVGLFISTFSRTQQQAYMGGFLFLLPANLLSGMLTPISSMPAWLRPVTFLNPLRYYIEILRSTLLKSAGVVDLWAELAALAAFGLLILLASALRFRTRLA
jgi:ABC-2 type transport system permease protein